MTVGGLMAERVGEERKEKLINTGCRRTDGDFCILSFISVDWVVKETLAVFARAINSPYEEKLIRVD